MAVTRTTAAAAVLALLSGCTVFDNISGFFNKNENRLRPAELVDFDAAIDVQRVWSTSVGNGAGKHYLKLAPTVRDDVVYAAATDGAVAAIRAEDGRDLWQTRLRNVQITGGPGVGAGLVLVGTSEAEVIALDAATGEQRWRVRVSSEVLAPPHGGAGVVVARTIDGRIYGLDAANGETLWQDVATVPTLTLRGTSAPAIVGNTVIVGYDNGRVKALDIATGRPVWPEEVTVSIPSGRTELDRMVDVDAHPVVFDGSVYVASFQGEVAALDMSDGYTQWLREVSTYAGLAADSNHVYVADATGNVWCLDRQTGNSVWMQDSLIRRQLSAPAALGNHLVVGDFEGYLHWLDAGSGEFSARVRLDGSRVIVAPVTTAGDLLIAYSSSGRLAAFRAM